MWQGEDGFSFGQVFAKTITVSPILAYCRVLMLALQRSTRSTWLFIVVVTFTLVDDSGQFHRQLHFLRRCCFSLARRSETCGRMWFGEVLPICYWKCWARSRTSCPIGGDIQTTTEPYKKTSKKRPGPVCVWNKHVRCSFLWQNPCCAFVQKHATFVTSGINKSELTCFFRAVSHGIVCF